MNRNGQIRLRDEAGSKVIYVKVGENRWVSIYAGEDRVIEGHASDPVATRWPVLYDPVYEENLK